MYTFRSSLAALLVLPALVFGAGAAPGGDTPQAVAERVQNATKSRNGYELAASLAPKTRAEMAAGAMTGAAMMVGMMRMGDDEEKAAEAAELEKGLNGILAKYGIEERMNKAEAAGEKADPEKLLEGVDTAALVGDLMKFMEKIPGAQKNEKLPPLAAEEKIGDFKIDGDRATAKGKGVELRFEKIADRWYLAELPGESSGTPGGSAEQ